jgi:glutathione S-transferase
VSAPAELVLYRCPTRTDWLCPCGAVSRRLRKLGLDHRVERVPYRRRDRPEVLELTGQKRVPLLIDGNEVIHDSKRIVEYLEWRYGTASGEASEPA